ncbi:hypothetical protein ACO0KY_01300 [Undibacterium sp. Dicai25W]|uniref:hypothetical protein n=1 Tax=Undibacterium sp. Dicai25W TaxID=3413034 RepID=UPI003BEFA75B
MDENFRYKTQNYSLHFVLRQIESGRMSVTPEFKDLKAQSNRERSLFIESLILGIPTQPIWCEESPFGDYIVIEGSERLVTIVDFVMGKFPLTTLKIRKEYRGYHFKSLPYHEKISLEDRYPFTFVIINNDTPPRLKCEFFRRLLNDTGNTNDQAARNFAWPRTFRFLQEIKNSCESLIDFAPRDPRWHLHPKTTKVSSEIDEVFLYMLMIYSILRGDVFEEAYLDDSISINDLLDRTMSDFDNSNGKRIEASGAIHWALSQISKYLGQAPKVFLSNSIRKIRLHNPNEELSLPELYLLFVRVYSNKINESNNWETAKANRFIKSYPARNLISYLFEARNA